MRDWIKLVESDEFDDGVYERESRIEAAVRKVCERHSLDVSGRRSITVLGNDLSVSILDGGLTLTTLESFKAFGDNVWVFRNESDGFTIEVTLRPDL